MRPIVKRVVIKFGTEVLLTENHLDQKIFDNVALQVRQIQELGVDVVIVTSGAIKAGKEKRTRSRKFVEGIPESILAGTGNLPLLIMWSNAFEPDQEIAQILVTHANLGDEHEKNATRSVILAAPSLSVVPVINANDIVSDEERKGISENDQLACLVAELIDADGILFLTSCGGVYKDSPGNLYKEIDIPTAKLIASASRSKSTNGRGGMSAKLDSAIVCREGGMHTVIAGLGEDTILRFATGRDVGTRIGFSVR
ncbi:MAG: hypothetical protein PHS53_03340 [Candidatus Pacebacteria bacterium]|nr:hypothetical protein [Candidatus Paceibacterota bacterium]MDD5357150.1 hypothetical protein [Candidatus Paceibacterota bacterium]